MQKAGELQSRYQSGAQEREPYLKRGRGYAALTHPPILTDESFGSNDRLASNFQGQGARGLSSITSLVHSSGYPIGHPWIGQQVSHEVRNAPDVDQALVRLVDGGLIARERIVRSLLMSTKLATRGNRRPATFLSQKYTHIDTILITGDSCQRFSDDTRLINYRRDQWVCKRDEEGNLTFVAVLQKVDPLTLRVKGKTTEQIAEAAGMQHYGLIEKRPEDRLMDMYTAAEYQHDAGNWVIRQELNGQIIATSTEALCPFIVTPYWLLPGESYGRGFVEQQIAGDLLSIDNLREKMLDWANQAADIRWVLDKNSPYTRPEDLRRKVLRGEVLGGAVQNIARLGVNGMADFNVAATAEQRISEEMSRTMMLEAELQPKGDRVTATQIRRLSQLGDSATGGLRAHLIDEDTIQTMQWANYAAQKKKLLRPLPFDDTDIETLTGLAVHQRQIDAETLTNSLLLAGQMLGERAAEEINYRSVIGRILELQGIQETDIFKTEEQKRAFQQAALEAQAASRAADAAIDTTAEVAREQLTS